MLAPIYNAVNKLLARWTATKAGYLDAAVSTRAPSSTALTNVTWTDAKAGYLDVAASTRAPSSTALTNVTWTDAKAGYLDAAISSRLASAIRSIQGGKIDTSTLSTGSNDEARYVDVTISAVTIAKCLVIVAGVFSSSSSTAFSALETARRNSAYSSSARAYLTSTTNLRIYGNPTADTYYGASVRWQVIEYA